MAAARKLAEPGPVRDLTLNIGRGEGVSVREMVDLIAEITGHEGVTAEVTPRRPGDPARVVATADRITSELGWKAHHDVRDMITSAWAGWQHHRPQERTRPGPARPGRRPARRRAAVSRPAAAAAPPPRARRPGS